MNSQSSDPGIGRRITRYGTILAISGILCKILLLIYTVYAVEILGKELFGRIEYMAEMAIIFAVLLDFGLEQTVTRELARQRNKISQYLCPLLLFRLISTGVGVVIMVSFLALTAQSHHTWALILSATFYFSVAVNSMLIRAIIRSLEWLALEGIANIIDKIVQISCAFYLLFHYPKLPLIMLCYGIGSLASVSFFLIILYKNIQCTDKRLSFSTGFQWQKLAIPIGLSAACILLLHRQDTAMVNWIQGDAETGLYRAPYRFLEGLFLFPQVLAISASPIFAKLYHEGKPFYDTASQMLRGLLMISLPIAVGGVCIAEEMILWLTPELGLPGAGVFSILLWSLPFIYANFLLGTILIATDRQRYNLQASFMGLICNAVLNIPAIYWWGAFGASVVTILSQGLYTALMFRHTKQFISGEDSWRYISILAACILMAAVLLSIQVAWYFSVIIGAAIYGILVFSFGGIATKDIRNITSMLKQKKP